jgi:hypothetical protein
MKPTAENQNEAVEPEYKLARKREFQLTHPAKKRTLPGNTRGGAGFIS